MFGGGYLAQFVRNYQQWKDAGGTPGDGSSPATPVLSFSACCEALFSKSGIIGVGLCLLLLGLLIVMVMRMGYSDVGEYDAERNLTYSNKGTYGTAGFMEKAEMKGVLDLVSDIRKHSGVILGKLDNQVVCIPENSRLNGNIAVFGASGSMKTRAYCINRILQSASEAHNGHKESLIITDPKSELYEKTSEYLRSKGYVVRVFNLIQPENSDSWNCLAEIEGDELMAQIFCDIIIKNTGSEKGDHFWNAAEMNLLKALVLYVALGYPPESRNIGEVYKLLVLNAEKELDNLFSMLPASHPARAPYALFSQSSDTVRSGVIIGLGSRLQVFQNRPICQITSHDEIDMELPGKQPCAYFCITSDQDSTFDFLTSLFLSFAFIKLIRYADKNCADRRLPVPVHVLGEELTACGVIPDLSRKISVIRSRGVSMSCVFQNLAGLQNRYPYNQWQEILGCCDYCRLQRSKERRCFPVSEIFDTEADSRRAMASGIRSFQEQLAEVDALSLLESAKRQYDGVARLGIEAMQLKFIGLSNTDIAAHYGIKANYLGAAVHRAAERLKSNKEFLQSLEYEPMKKGSKAS